MENQKRKIDKIYIFHKELSIISAHTYSNTGKYDELNAKKSIMEYRYFVIVKNFPMIQFQMK